MNRDTFYHTIGTTLASFKAPKVIESSQGSYLTIEGKQQLNFCSSHYLGLSVNKRLQKAVASATATYGIGTGYRTLAGTHKLHIELEAAIAKFKGTEAAVTFSSAYMANCAAIQTIIGKEDIVISDELNHASIIDAIRLSGVKNKFVYKHTDMKDLERCLKESAKIQSTVIPTEAISRVEGSNSKKSSEEDSSTPLRFARNDKFPPRTLIVTDGVFSMDGDLAPLPDIVALAKKYGALLMVDDAHGEGVLGTGGRGIVDHFKLLGQVDIEVGSLSKAFSVLGGFIAGKKMLIDYYNMKARQRLFSIALSIADTAASLEAIRILQESDAVVAKLWDNVNYLRTEFKRLGFDTGNSQTPITPVMLKSEEIAKEFSAKLYEHGVFATPIVYPMVPLGRARIRVIPSAGHSRKDLDFGISMFAKIGKELGVI